MSEGGEPQEGRQSRERQANLAGKRNPEVAPNGRFVARERNRKRGGMAKADALPVRGNTLEGRKPRRATCSVSV
jgi:hypothetical protein